MPVFSLKMLRIAGWSMTIAVAFLMIDAAGIVRADPKKITVSTLYGVNYLPMQVLKRDRMIEKHAAALGLGPVDVVFVQLASGAAAFDGLLSGSVDIAALGVPPMI